MRRRNNGKTFHLTVSHFKILETIKCLNDMHKYSTPKGVNNILTGKFDVETRQFASFQTFGTLISFHGRKICSYILNMVRRGYLAYIYDENTDGMYLYITEKGEEELFTFQKKHKEEYKKKTPKSKPEIVEL